MGERSEGGRERRGEREVREGEMETVAGRESEGEREGNSGGETDK